MNELEKINKLFLNLIEDKIHFHYFLLIYKKIRDKINNKKLNFLPKISDSTFFYKYLDYINSYYYYNLDIYDIQKTEIEIENKYKQLLSEHKKYIKNIFESAEETIILNILNKESNNKFDQTFLKNELNNKILYVKNIFINKYKNIYENIINYIKNPNELIINNDDNIDSDKSNSTNNDNNIDSNGSNSTNNDNNIESDKSNLTNNDIDLDESNSTNNDIDSDESNSSEFNYKKYLYLLKLNKKNNNDVKYSLLRRRKNNKKNFS